MWNKYLTPKSVDEAIACLDKEKGQAIVIGGGTDLIPQYRNHKKNSKCLVDVTRISSMSKLTMDEDIISIGGAVTHAQIAESNIIHEYASVLAFACEAVGSPQIRNKGTLSGNIVNAQPAADGTIALVALDAQAVIVSVDGRRTVPIVDLFEGVGKSKVDSTHEIIEKIYFRALRREDGEASAVERLALRKALSLPIINVAVSLKIFNERLDWVRIAIGPVSQTPYRPYDIEEEMRGCILDLNNINIFSEELSKIVTPRDSLLRGSADYRRAMVKVLVKRAMLKAKSQIKDVE